MINTSPPITPMLRVMSLRDIRLLFAGTTTSLVGDQLALIATPTVEGRNDDILRFTDLSGHSVAIMPMALWSVVKDTPGVYRFQAIQTAPNPGSGKFRHVWADVRSQDAPELHQFASNTS